MTNRGYASPEMGRYLSRAPASSGRESPRFRRPFVDALHAADAVTYMQSLDGRPRSSANWDLGVYSNETFPSLGTTTPTVRASTFSTTRVEANPRA